MHSTKGLHPKDEQTEINFDFAFNVNLIYYNYYIISF